MSEAVWMMELHQGSWCHHEGLHLTILKKSSDTASKNKEHDGSRRSGHCNSRTLQNNFISSEIRCTDNQNGLKGRLPRDTKTLKTGKTVSVTSFRSEVLPRLETTNVVGLQRSDDIPYGGLMMSKTLSAGLHKFEFFHSKGLQRSKIVNSARLQTPDAFHSKGPQRLEHFKSAEFCKSNSFACGRSEILHRSPTMPTTHERDGKNLKTFHSDGLHTFDEFQAQTFNECTYFEVTRYFKHFLPPAVYVLTILISMILKIARIFHHEVVLIALLLQAARSDVHLNCTDTAVVTSPNYPDNYPEYQSIAQFIAAPEGRMILLHFDDFSLASEDELEIGDILQPSHRRRYNGREHTPVHTLPPFLSRGNRVLLRFLTYESFNGKGYKISASCFQISETRVGRLVGGSTPAEGFLELQTETGSRWWKVCAEHLPYRVAEVICGELGFPGVKKVSYQTGECHTNGGDWDCVQAPNCGDLAYLSQDCSPASKNCTSSMAVKVTCFEPGYKGCFDFQQAHLQNRTTHNTTSQCISSCRTNTSQAIAITNGSSCVCSTSGLSGIATEEVDQSWCQRANRSTTYQAVYNATVGFCNRMDDVMNGYWDSSITWFGSIVHLKCDDGYRLNGSGTLQCVQGVSPLVPVWNDSLPKCKMNEDTDGDTDISSPTNITGSSASVPEGADNFSSGKAVGISVSIITVTMISCIVGVSI